MSWQGKPPIAWELQNTAPDWKDMRRQSDNSLGNTDWYSISGIPQNILLHLAMPSILNTPANEIPIHFFHLPIAQREILLVNILTDPILYERAINLALYHNNPVFPQAITLFHSYVLIHQLFACLAIPHLPVQITEAFNPTLSVARTAVLVLLMDRGLSPCQHSPNGSPLPLRGAAYHLLWW